tara:strand:+ start:76 stop:441 length:366 start_codon:yes stop_codon:yes gene_type:complete
MKTELNKTSNSIDELPVISDRVYERIFNVYKEGNYYAYNILKTVNIPRNLDDEIFYYSRIIGKTTWTQLSFDHYSTIRLWWLICVTNKIMNPVLLPKQGTVIRIIKQEYVNSILEQITESL